MTIDNFLVAPSAGKVKLCPECNVIKPFEEFPKNRTDKKTGKVIRRGYCHPCWYKVVKRRHPSTNLSRRRYSKKHLDVNKKFIIEYLQKNPCVDCGITDVRVLEFDHIGVKTKNISELIQRPHTLEKIKKEITQCEVVCANCHRIRTMVRGNHYRHRMVNE